MNQLVETLDNGTFRKTQSNAPFNESDNARLLMVGPFRFPNIGASQAATGMTLGGVDSDAPKDTQMLRGGRIKGVYVRQSAAITGGSVTIQPKKGSSAEGGTVVLTTSSGQKLWKTYTEDAAPTFKGADTTADDLGVDISSAAGVTPTTTDISVWVAVELDV